MLPSIQLVQRCGRGFVSYLLEIMSAGFPGMELFPFGIGAVFIEFIHGPGINDAPGNAAFDLLNAACAALRPLCRGTEKDDDDTDDQNDKNG